MTAITTAAPEAVAITLDVRDLAKAIRDTFARFDELRAMPDDARRLVTALIKGDPAADVPSQVAFLSATWLSLTGRKAKEFDGDPERLTRVVRDEAQAVIDGTATITLAEV